MIMMMMILVGGKWFLFYKGVKYKFHYYLLTHYKFSVEVDLSWLQLATFFMSPHKGPQIIRYCVITSTAALVAIVVGLIPQFKVNKAKLLCAEYYSLKDSSKGKGFPTSEKIQKNFIRNEEGNVSNYCRSL